MENIIFTSYSRPEFLEIVKEALAACLAEHPVSKETAAAQDDKINGIQGLADYLGVKKNAIHSYKRNGIVPFYQTGKAIYFKKSEVDACLSSKTITRKNK